MVMILGAAVVVVARFRHFVAQFLGMARGAATGFIMHVAHHRHDLGRDVRLGELVLLFLVVGEGDHPQRSVRIAIAAAIQAVAMLTPDQLERHRRIPLSSHPSSDNALATWPMYDYDRVSVDACRAGSQ